MAPESANTQADLHSLIRALIYAIGDDPDREGLLDTPKRVIRSWSEMYAGYEQDEAEILKCDFAAEDYDQLIVVRDIPFTSNCEHHMLPFNGTASVGYLPGERIVGLSKIPRLIRMYAQRLQIQERMTRQIAQAMFNHLHPRGVGVVIRAVHLCCVSRGVRTNAEMVTSDLLGDLRTTPGLRAEFFHLIGVSK